jgi:hypothetical protein
MCRKLSLAFALALIAAGAYAQTTHSMFTIGPRLSSYSTDIDAGPAPIKTGRQSSFGVVGDYRTGNFVLDFSYDHDPENGIRLTDLIVDVGNYRRDRGEATVGLALLSVLDIEGGLRVESFRVGGFSLFGSNLDSDLNLDHQAITAGLNLHSDPSQRVGFHVKGRGYVGSAKFDDATGTNVNADTTGWRGEAGLDVRIGESNWYVSPGVEYEHLETKDYDLRFNTNRFFLNFVFRAR